MSLVLRIQETVDGGLDEIFGPFPDELARDRFHVLARESGRYRKGTSYHFTTIEDPLPVALAWGLDKTKGERTRRTRTETH